VSTPALPLPWLEQPLQAALQQTHGHATLIHGAEGVGQYEFALALAQSCLCEARPTGASSPQLACGHCESCHLISARSHPDLIVVLPEVLQSALGWGSAQDEGEGAQEKSGKTRKPSQEIKVEAIRAVVQFAQSTSSRGRAKVVLIHPAERMNTVACNTLLKTLEEPPGVVRFLISASSLDELLPTVRSRCQAWRLPMPEASAATAWLQAQIPGLSDADALVLLAATGGQPLTARDRHALGLDASRWPLVPGEVAQGQSPSMAGWPLPLVVETLQRLCHDLSRVAVGAPPQYFPAPSLPQVPDLERLMAWSKSLRDLRRHAEHPWNPGLKVEALLQQARLVLRQRPAR